MSKYSSSCSRIEIQPATRRSVQLQRESVVARDLRYW